MAASGRSSLASVLKETFGSMGEPGSSVDGIATWDEGGMSTGGGVAGMTSFDEGSEATTPLLELDISSASGAIVAESKCASMRGCDGAES